jgi:predicted transcriptional regulator
MDKIDRVANDVESIKKFMIIGLISQGFSQEEVGKLMNIGQSGVSEMFPGGILKKAKALKKA